MHQLMFKSIAVFEVIKNSHLRLYKKANAIYEFILLGLVTIATLK